MNQLTDGRPAAEDAAAHAETLIALGRYEQALSSIGRGLILAPTDSRLHFQRAVARQRLGRFRDASRSAGEAISADPNDARAYDLKASSLAAQARTRLRPWRQQLGRQARDAARRAVQLAPADAQCHCTAAEAELLAGDWQAARTVALQALQLAPGRPEPYVAVAQVALAGRDFATARAAALRALAIEPGSYAATNHLGSALAGLGHWKRAAATYADAARLDPQAEPAKRNLVRLGVSMLVPALLGVMLLLLAAPHGVVVVPLTCLTAGTAVARSARLRRKAGHLGLVVALRLGRLDRSGGLIAVTVATAAAGVALAALTAAVGAAVAGPALLVATVPVVAGYLGAMGLRAVFRSARIGHRAAGDVPDDPAVDFDPAGGLFPRRLGLLRRVPRRQRR